MPLTDDLLERKKRYAFAGLFEDDTVTIPETVRKALDLPRSPAYCYKDIVQRLPDAEPRRVFVENRHVDEDTGDVDVDGVEDALDHPELPDIERLNMDCTPDSDRARQRMADYKAVVDPRREALASTANYDCRYHWQVPTSGYTIVNPTDWYYAAQRVFEKGGANDSVFGWVEFDDYGGAVDFYILFKDETIKPPSAAHDPTGSEDTADRDPVYLGMHTGYELTGSRALDCRLFGFDAEHETPLWHLGDKQSRRHEGSALDDAKEFFAGTYEAITNIEGSSGLLQDVSTASSRIFDFGELEFSLEEFLKYIGLDPVAYQEEAAKRARQFSPYEDAVSAWNLFISVSLTLLEEYEGDKRSSPTFMGYARVAQKLLDDPDERMRLAVREYNRDDGDETPTVPASQTQLVTDPADIDGYETEDEMSAAEMTTATDWVQQQLSG